MAVNFLKKGGADPKADQKDVDKSKCLGKRACVDDVSEGATGTGDDEGEDLEDTNGTVIEEEPVVPASVPTSQKSAKTVAQPASKSRRSASPTKSTGCPVQPMPFTFSLGI
ncbi:hypothetical protein U1Q18_032792 [Sarracenia purpurea var. burkii]